MLQLNRAKFSANGNCGYVLKPPCMCHGEAWGTWGCGWGCRRAARAASAGPPSGSRWDAVRDPFSARGVQGLSQGAPPVLCRSPASSPDTPVPTQVC